jgi:hypothetical protein
MENGEPRIQGQNRAVQVLKYGALVRCWRIAPAPLSPARTAAIAAATTVAAITAVAAAATVTAITAEATTTTTAATARTAAFAALVRGVNAERPTVEHLTVHGVRRRLGFAFSRIFDETESA